MRALALAPSLLLAPALLVAQGPAQPVIARVESASVTSSSGTCPVGFDLHRNSPGLVANVDNASSHRGSQRIFFTLSPTGERSVRSIELTVHAISPGARIYPARSLAEPTPDIDRDFKISAPDSLGLHGRNLWVDGVGTILSVDLTSITYTDGFTWHASPASACHAVPNGFTLVNVTASQ